MLNNHMARPIEYKKESCFYCTKGKVKDIIKVDGVEEEIEVECTRCGGSGEQIREI